MNRNEKMTPLTNGYESTPLLQLLQPFPQLRPHGLLLPFFTAEHVFSISSEEKKKKINKAGSMYIDYTRFLIH